MYEKLPEQLKKDGRFCLWKYEERNGRMTKVPYQTNGRKASSAGFSIGSQCIGCLCRNRYGCI